MKIDEAFLLLSHARFSFFFHIKEISNSFQLFPNLKAGATCLKTVRIIFWAHFSVTEFPNTSFFFFFFFTSHFLTREWPAVGPRPPSHCVLSRISKRWSLFITNCKNWRIPNEGGWRAHYFNIRSSMLNY